MTPMLQADPEKSMIAIGLFCGLNADELKAATCMAYLFRTHPEEMYAITEAAFEFLPSVTKGPQDNRDVIAGCEIGYKAMMKNVGWSEDEQ